MPENKIVEKVKIWRWTFDSLRMFCGWWFRGSDMLRKSVFCKDLIIINSSDNP